jgi:hypothetical protein
MNLPYEHHPFDWNQIAREREQKKSLLKDFFENESVDYMNDIPRATHKFLYLYGHTNTGKLTLVKEVAQETFGNDWESKVYLRIDDGQRFPYKLHAHKVESSRKVILITNKRVHWLKWKELYPTTKTFFFEGAEVIPSTQGHVTIRYTEYFQQNKNNNIQMKSDIDQIIASFFQGHNLSEELSVELRSSIKNRLIEHWRNSVNLFQASEVTNVLV